MDILKNGSHFKEQDQVASEALKSSAEDTEAIVTDSDPLISLKSAHDDRYEEFKSFMKAQRVFNNKIERQISMNSVALNENVIELQDLEQKCENQTKEVKLSCERRIEDVRSEIGEEVQKLVDKITSLNSKLSSELKILKNKASSTEDSIKLILYQLDEIKTKVCSSEQSLLERIQETSVTSTRLNSQEPAPTPHGTENSDSKEVRTYAVVTSNRYESLVEETVRLMNPYLQACNQSSPSLTINQKLLQAPLLKARNLKSNNMLQQDLTEIRNISTPQMALFYY